MLLGRLGGALMVGGCALFILTGVIFVFGGSVGMGGATTAGLILAAGLGLVGVGAVSLAVAGPRPLDNRGIRFGLATLGFGLLVYLSSTVISAGMEFDPLESWTFVMTFLIGGLATLLGTITTVVALLLVRGPSRVVGALFPIGIVLLVLASTVAHATVGGALFEVIGTLIAIAGGFTVMASAIGVGLLPWYVARSSAPVVTA